MLCKDGDNFGALPPEVARTWAFEKNIPFLIGAKILSRFFKVEQDPNHMKVSKTSIILYWIVIILCMERG
jgi:hypothetical protein